MEHPIHYAAAHEPSYIFLLYSLIDEVVIAAT